MNKYDEKLGSEFALLSNLELEILINCKVRSYYVKKRAVAITKYLLEEYGYVGSYGIDEVTMDRELYDFLRIAKVRMVRVNKINNIVVTKDDIINVIKIYKDRDKNMGLNNELFFDEMINSINDDVLDKFNMIDKKVLKKA